MSRKPCTHDQFQAKVEAEFRRHGAQHFESRGVITNKRVQDSIRRDRIKDDFCEENGISLYRIRHNENHKQRIVQILDKHHLVDVKLL